MITGHRCACAMMVALVIVSATSAAAEERSYGRLFFTPEQRQQLDAGRREAIANRNRPAPAKEAPAAPKAAPPQVVTLHGVVRRNDGETTVWVNGRPVSSRFGDADIHAGTITRDSVGFDIPGAKRRVRLKVGQSVEATSGTIEEGYRRRRTLPSAAVPVETPAGTASGNTVAPRPVTPGNRRGSQDEESSNADAGGNS